MLFNFQGGKCPVCDKELGEEGLWAMDHCKQLEQQTGVRKVRGIIHKVKCNPMLHLFETDESRNRVEVYLGLTPTTKVSGNHSAIGMAGDLRSPG